MSNTTFKLIEVVINSSLAKTFEDAKYEWSVVDYVRNDNEQCICGKKHIKHCYTICNKETDKILFPIGSECIKKFERQDLLRQMKVISNKNTIFKNTGRKHDGKTYGYICENDFKYIEYLKEKATNKVYLKLIEYYNHQHK